MNRAGFAVHDVTSNAAALEHLGSFALPGLAPAGYQAVYMGSAVTPVDPDNRLDGGACPTVR